MDTQNQVRILFIDDDTAVIKTLRKVLQFQQIDAMFRQCTSTAEALLAIKEEEPHILFLDNDLGGAGNQGLQIVDALLAQKADINIYSMTTNPAIMDEYTRRNIETLSKMNVGVLISHIKPAGQITVPKKIEVISLNTRPPSHDYLEIGRYDVFKISDPMADSGNNWLIVRRKPQEKGVGMSEFMWLELHGIKPE